MIRNVKNLFKKKKNRKRTEGKDTSTLKSKMDELSVENLRTMFTDCSDVVYHTFTNNEKKPLYIVYIEGISNVQALDQQVIAPIIKEQTTQDVFGSLKQLLPLTNIKKIKSLQEGADSIANGNPVLLCEGIDYAYSLGLAKWEKRPVEEPEAESGIRGPREGFTEAISVNTALVRRIIKDSRLKMKGIQIGKYTKTKIFLAYIEGLANENLIKEVENRLNRIQIDGILESSYIEELIEDNPYSPFPQLLNTERPDVVAASLLEGRFALMIEGTPFSLIAPISFFGLFQSQEDYYERFWMGSFIRIIRFLFLGISLFLPSFYVAVTTFHQEMVPTELLLSIASAREGVPFPALIEVIMMELAFEGLREAGVRLPKQIGSAVSIVGALVIGQAAVQAGIVSAPMVIVVSITGIASFLIPRYSVGITIRLLRFPIIFMAGFLGLTGIMLAFILLIIHLSTLRSFGLPYLTPFAPFKKSELKDSLFRAPLWKMNTRPHLTGKYNENRQAPNLRPSPNKGGE